MHGSNPRVSHVVLPRMRLLAAAGLLLTGTACSASSPAAPEIGDEFELSRTYETTERTSDGSSGSSNGRDGMLERVIALRDGGLELEFDLPEAATADDRARSWQFPVRVLRAPDGSMQLLNRPDLEARLERWLAAAELTRDACGRWIFTWNAFRIECDPESAIAMIQAFDLRSIEVREGATYRDPGARGPGTLTEKSTGPDGATYVVELEIDPDAVRRANAESDVVLGEIMQKPVTLEAALGERAKDDVTGTMSVTLETDAAGNVTRRTRVTDVDIGKQDGVTESRTVTETVERRAASVR